MRSGVKGGMGQAQKYKALECVGMCCEAFEGVFVEKFIPLCGSHRMKPMPNVHSANLSALCSLVIWAWEHVDTYKSPGD
jgi:hypothetical protein